MESKVKLSIGGFDVAVTGLYHNSKEVKKGGLFFVLKDNKHVDEAVNNGASVIVTEVGIVVDSKVKHIVVDDVRETMALTAKQFFCNISDKMRITAVVGTNGKTTTTYIVKHILEIAYGKNVGLIGTTGIFGAGKSWDGITTLTTPDPIDLHKAMFSMYHSGIRDVVMEVSAHAIYYKKVAGINFNSVIFTNITQDHLDFFSSFDHYKNTKLLFFKEFTKGIIVINADDEYSDEVVNSVRGKQEVRAISYSLKKDTVVGTDEWAFVDNVKLSASGSDFDISKIGTCHIAIPGIFNVYNGVAAALVCNSYGISWEIIKEGLSTLPSVPGRFNSYNIFGINVIIDYAHTPDGLEKLLLASRGLLQNNTAKLISVFGCGGDRDRIKRPKMGIISFKIADYTVLTSDNPRTENPDTIIDEIERGIKTSSVDALLNSLDKTDNGKYTRITDRAKAIAYAIEKANAGDIVVIAGKGHEDYMDINGEKIPYTDSKVLDNILRSTNEYKN